VASNSLIEHSAGCDTVDFSQLDTESNNPVGVLIHHEQDPMGSQGSRFTPEQIETPEAVLQVSNEGQPGWTTGTRFGPIMTGENPSHNVLIDLDIESQGNQLSNPRTASAGIALLCLNDGLNEFFAGPFWAGPFLVL
jgi:hypothetical protein